MYLFFYLEMNNLLIEIIKNISSEIDISRFLVIGNAFEKRSLFLYKHGEQKPYALLKIPGSTEGERRCKIEYDGLIYLNNHKIPTVISSEPLGVFKFKGINCYMQQILKSKSMLFILPKYYKRIKEKYFFKITDHLIQIYITTKKKNINNKSYSHCFKHGDCWIGNLGVRNDDLVLYDLEFSSQHGYPLYDLLHFGIYYLIISKNIGLIGKEIITEQYNRNDERRKFNITKEIIMETLIGPSQLSEIMKKCIYRYISKCNISMDDTIQLIKNYIEIDRKFIETEKNWERTIF